MKRVGLVVAYDGTNYCGWQTQPNGVTIQGILNETLSELLGEEIETIGASRTDAGVHALGNVAVFDTDTRIPGEKISYAVTILPFIFLLAALGNSKEALLFGAAIIVLLVWYMDEITKDKLTNRRDEILRDFPQVLSKLTLLVNSGMVLRDAWKNVAEKGNGILYEEMLQTCEEMKQGVAEIDAYQNFAERCEVKEIKRFTSSIIQNMVKGNAELTKFLREMSDEMWNEKKNMVKRKGEIANSKLLVPIMLIFIGILIVIMVPMFTSM